MQRHNRPHRAAFRVRVSVVIVLSFTFVLVLLLMSSPTHAHPDGEAHHNVLPTHATEVMRRFWQDQVGPEPLAALSAASCSDGSAAGYPCSNVDLLAFMPLADIGGTRSNSAANDIWGWTDPQTGKEYAIVGRVFGTSFVDISNPSSPVYLGELPTHGAFGSSWRDIKTYANHAFIVSEANQHGMQVFDLTQLRSVTNPPVTFSETAHYNKNASAHNIVINEATGYAYIVGAAGKNSCNGGLHMVDIGNPTSPSFAGCYSGDGYTHDAQCVLYTGPDAQHQGKEICFNSNEDTLTIVDVTNKANPVLISRRGYSGSAYTHQGWLTEDQTYFLLDDELDEQNFGHNTRTRVWNVADLDNPALSGIYDSSVAAIDHNQYVKGNFSYQANYRAGLRILDVANAASGSLAEVAYFDIYPTDDRAEFNAAWSNYPYFNSGVVIVSGIEQGLFILQPSLGPVDTPPSVTITAPANGSTVSGTEVTISADASDDNGVTEVAFFADGAPIGVVSSAPYNITWDSTSVGDGSRVISATATDSSGQTGSDSVTVVVDNVADPTNPTMHVGDLDGSSASTGKGGKWKATVTITVHNATEAAVANASVSGSWSGSTSGTGSCVTDGSGQCSVTSSDINRNATSVTFTVDDITASGLEYAAGDNHDPDGSSTGTIINISRPQ